MLRRSVVVYRRVDGGAHERARCTPLRLLLVLMQLMRLQLLVLGILGVWG